MGKQKKPRQKARAAKLEAQKSASTTNTKMDVDGKEIEVSDLHTKGASFKSTKAQLEGQISKIDKRALRQRMLMQKLVVGGNATKSNNKKDLIVIEEDSLPGEMLKRLHPEKTKKATQNLKTKDKPIKKARQRRKQYIHNVLKITTQTTKKAAKEVTKEKLKGNS